MLNLSDIHNSTKKFDNRYRLIEKIGGGGFSEVWLANDTNAGIDVALKIYTPNGELDEEGKDDFKREFARLCDLNHSNIIHAIGFGIHEDELPYLAMSVCQNGSAKKLIGNVEESQVWEFIAQVASGLQYLHAHGITHQDIKPDNVLINSDGQYLIIDFGISTRTRNTLRKSTKGTVGGGTPWYMSVESWGTDSPNIQARDIWALGATLYEIIMGDVPFGQYGGVTQKSQNGRIPPITADVSEELKQLVYDCLSLNAWDRPDAGEIIMRAQNHKAGNNTKYYQNHNRIAFGVAVALVLGVCCYAGISAIDSIRDREEAKAVLIKNDSLFISKINEAVAIAEQEVNKKDISSVDEKTLCSAAIIHAEAILQTNVSDSIRTRGEQLWMTSQQLIDDTYEYLCQKQVEYDMIGASYASQTFNKRSLVLLDYISHKSATNNTE